MQKQKVNGYGLHVIKNPAGTYSFVGSVPSSLGNIVPANSSDIMALRAWENDNGELFVVKFPVFKNKKDAVNYASKYGYLVNK